MARTKPGAPGTAIFRVGQGRLTHEQHIARCLEKMPPDWKDDGTGQNYPNTWTGGDIAAWKAEMARVPVIEALIAMAARQSHYGTKDRELFLKYIGTPEMKSAGTTVNIGQKVTQIGQVNVRVITGDDIRTPQQLQAAQTMPRLGAGQGEVVEGEAVEVGAASGGEGGGEREGGAGEERG